MQTNHPIASIALLAMVAVCCLVGCAAPHEPRLSGTYISDKEATMEYLRETGQYDEASIQTVGSLLGKMTVTYTNGVVRSDLNGFVEEEPLKLLESHPTHVVIEGTFLDEPTPYTLFFTNDGYWVEGGFMAPPFREKFKRVEQGFRQGSEGE